MLTGSGLSSRPKALVVFSGHSPEGHVQEVVSSFHWSLYYRICHWHLCCPPPPSSLTSCSSHVQRLSGQTYCGQFPHVLSSWRFTPPSKIQFQSVFALQSKPLFTFCFSLTQLTTVSSWYRPNIYVPLINLHSPLHYTPGCGSQGAGSVYSIVRERGSIIASDYDYFYLNDPLVWHRFHDPNPVRLSGLGTNIWDPTASCAKVLTETRTSLKKAFI
ncbi:hypothetical protein AMECASPLE_030782 [Ameca splendens]|uniref:Uncharacterized protein n=1 Tax=Ameca splendens TaxID=208324 RepID=A0ABV0YIA9_9TELE